MRALEQVRLLFSAHPIALLPLFVALAVANTGFWLWMLYGKRKDG